MQIFMSLCIEVTHLLQLNTADANFSCFSPFLMDYQFQKDMKISVYNSKYEAILKMLLLYLVV